MFQIQEIQHNWTSQVQSLCYIVSKFDQQHWSDYLNAFPKVQANIDAGNQKIKGWAMFAEEVFLRLFAVPTPIPFEQLRPEVMWAEQLHDWIGDSVDFAEMQSACRGDKLAAGHGTARLLEIAIRLLPQPPEGFEDPTTVQAWEEAFTQVKAGIVALEKLQSELETKVANETDPQQLQHFQKQFEQVKFDLEQLREKLQQVEQHLGQIRQEMLDYADRLGDEVAEALMNAIIEAFGSVQSFQSSMNAFGWGDGMGMLNIPGNTKEKEAVAKRLTQDQRFRQIAEAAGRFQAIASLHQGAKRSRQLPEQVAGTSLGNDLSRITPGEWVRSVMEQSKALFMKDYVEEALVEVEFDGAVEEGQGPVVVCLDKSSSMDGKNEIDSTGLLLALLSIAQHQKRRAIAILFDNAVRYVKRLDPESATHKDWIDIADRTYSGGTDFMAPLNEALKAIEGQSEFREADVIFITDGQANVTTTFSEKWRETQKQLGFRVITLIVGSYVNPVVLDQFSDRNISVRDLSDPQVHEVFDI